jgi:hypothetical protein
MINQLVAIWILIVSVVLTADLFIKKDQSLNRTVKNFEIQTKNLHHHQK